MINLTGKKFGKLTAIKKVASILSGKKLRSAWECKCDCGNIKIIKTNNLLRGSTRSCGCLYDEYGKSLKPGQKINRLTTISYANGKWTCHCECGNLVTTTTDKLNNNNTKSCGCLKTELSSKNAIKLIAKRRKFEPKIASARRIWKSYCYRDSNCVDFDEFFKLSQQKCFYCGAEPNTKYNYFLTISSNSSQKGKEEGLFIYNGLDRIDSSKKHTIDNVLPCCYNCNRAKNNLSSTVFLTWINNLKLTEFTPLIIKQSSFPSGALSTSIKCVFYNYKKDSDMTVEEFYWISQNNCFYCNSFPSNKFNYAKINKKSAQKAKDSGDFIYNGLDRIDPKQNHNKNNVVPCCKYCNFAKSKLTLSEFNEWIDRIQKYQIKKHGD